KIADQIRKGVNLVILDLNTMGGKPDETKELARYLQQNINRQSCRTVALVRERAAGEIAMLALACDDILLMPGATLGGEGSFGTRNENERRRQIDTYATVIAGIARAKGRSPSLAAALIDRNAVVYRHVRENGQEDYFTTAELERERDPKSWQRKEEVTEPGAALALSPQRALELHMATPPGV